MIKSEAYPIGDNEAEDMANNKALDGASESPESRWSHVPEKKDLFEGPDAALNIENYLNWLESMEKKINYIRREHLFEVQRAISIMEYNTDKKVVEQEERAREIAFQIPDNNIVNLMKRCHESLEMKEIYKSKDFLKKAEDELAFWLDPKENLVSFIRPDSKLKFDAWIKETKEYIASIS